MNSNRKNPLDTSIEYLKGVGPLKADLLKKEARIFTYNDLLNDFPFRHIDKTKFLKIREVRRDQDYVQIKGIITRLQVIGSQRKKRLTAVLKDDTGMMELVWFKGVSWLEKNIQSGMEYVVYGKINVFNGRINIPHPALELASQAKKMSAHFAPVCHSTEKLSAKGLDAKGRRGLMKQLFSILNESMIEEVLPEYLLDKMDLITRYEAYRNIHFPTSNEALQAASKRLKFDELFFFQLRLMQLRSGRKKKFKGYVFQQLGEAFHKFYEEKIPFELTGAQKKVIKEIRADLGSGIHMNRLLQGDVGSGKTMVAIMSMLIALGNGYQACLLAPTEILAQQHFQSFNESLEGLGIKIAFLSGSIKGKKREKLFEELLSGEIQILIGTHAILEEPVKFKQLGIGIIDEQHRFGVAQRAKIWAKSKPYPPHILVMTATPIPRTLAMTSYGDLDVSVIDELPPGRKHVETFHKTETNRLWVLGFMRDRIAEGRQVYVVYPLIEESSKLDLNNLMEGYKALLREFPQPNYQISIVHGRMKAADKEMEMQRFVNKETQIMIATTVIEVGVNVPNASLMIIENTERFGLSQLHQLRGRVGRGSDQAYCILMTGNKLSNEGRERIETMCRTNDGFVIAEADLKLRGPGNVDNTQQSGFDLFKISDIVKDHELIKTCRQLAIRIIEKDSNLEHPLNQKMRAHLVKNYKLMKGWSNIS